LVDPAMRKAKTVFKAELFFVIFKKNAVSLHLLNTVPLENIFTIRDDNLQVFLIDVLKFIFWTRKQKIDTVIDLELFSRATAILTGLSGATNRIGYHAFHTEGLYRGNMLTHPVMYNPHMHIAKNFISLINALQSNDNDLPYSKTLISDEEVQLAQADISGSAKAMMHAKISALVPTYLPTQHSIILINPNASDLLPQRRWPRKHFEELIRLILKAYPASFVLLTGAPAEKAQAETLAQAVNDPRCINFAGQVKFIELLPLYAIAKLMVTNDSGPGHFSSVTPLPTIVLFGPETPALYGSLGNSTPIYLGLACSPCVSASNHRKTPCTNNICLQWITPASVMSQVQKILC
jgi:ADP-heptose:LPS heptosyltransferase